MLFLHTGRLVIKAHAKPNLGQSLKLEIQGPSPPKFQRYLQTNSPSMYPLTATPDKSQSVWEDEIFQWVAGRVLQFSHGHISLAASSLPLPGFSPGSFYTAHSLTPPTVSYALELQHTSPDSLTPAVFCPPELQQRPFLLLALLSNFIQGLWLRNTGSGTRDGSVMREPKRVSFKMNLDPGGKNKQPKMKNFSHP
jgi:hypothetical protein